MGGGWLIVGVGGLIWAGTSLVGSARLGQRPASSSPTTLDALWISPWAQIVVVFIAAFFLVAGWGLIRRYRWVQTLMVPAHLMFMVYAIVGWIAAFLVQSRSPLEWTGISVLLAVLILANGALALSMNSVGATEALSWLPLRTTPLVPLKCEFCGTPLDPGTNRCPQCEAVPETTHQNGNSRPVSAKLVGVLDKVEFRIDPDKATMIGRGSTRNDVNLSNPTVSRHHAQIAYEAGHYVLTALRDLNGTFINDTLVRKRPLQDGDEIRFGRSRFRFSVMESEHGA
jgi:hypothetical protein